MKKLFIKFVPIIMAGLLVGCCASIPLTPYNNEPYVNNPCDLSREDVHFIKKVQSETYHVYVATIGGFKNRHKNVVQDLYQYVDLEKNRYVVNITTTSFYNVICFGAVTIYRAFAEGDLVEIRSTKGTEIPLDTISNKENDPIEEEANVITKEDPDKCYIAWLINSGIFNKNAGLDAKTYSEASKLTTMYTKYELFERSKKHSKEVEKYKLVK